jgi:endonuclease G
MGNPSGATKDEGKPENYLVERDQYALSYNKTTGRANWVSWHLSTAWLGPEHRSKVFTPDTSLPTGWYFAVPSSYTGTGFDRGHMCPSGDRTATKADNNATFILSNVVPQTPPNNRQTWEGLESYCRKLAQEGNELYIIAGPVGIGGKGEKGFRLRIDGGGLSVPSATWKVIMVLPNGDSDVSRVDHTTRLIAVIVPNTMDVGDSWTNYLHSVDDVEGITGLDFFSEVPKDVQDVIEQQVDEPEDAGGGSSDGDGQ